LKDNDESATISVSDRHVELKDHLRDYQYRGEGLSSYNVYDFMLNTYEIIYHDEDPTAKTDDSDQMRRGRPKSVRIPYLPDAGKPHKCRVQRVVEHEHILRFVGQWFPHNKYNDFHAASILLLLKPWRLLTDLKESGETFEQSLSRFLATATKNQKDLVENIQYYHICWDVAQERRDALRQGKTFKLFDYEQDNLPAVDEEEDDDALDTNEQPENTTQPLNETFDENAIERARLDQRDKRDRVFANEAMQLAYAAKIFGDKYRTNVRSRTFLARRANEDDMKIFTNWAAVLNDITQKQIKVTSPIYRTRSYICTLQPSIVMLKTAANAEHSSDHVTNYS